jgi:hypothetical protein
VRANSGDGDSNRGYVTHWGAFTASHNAAYQTWFDAGSHAVLSLSPTETLPSLAACVYTLPRTRRLTQCEAHSKAVRLAQDVTGSVE